MRNTTAALTLLACCALYGTTVAQEKEPAPGEPKPPKARHYSYIYDMLDHSLLRPATRVLDLPLLARKITSNRREAYNVDENDQVRLPSTWWQPRIGFRPVTVEQMLAGPGTGKGPAPGRWTVKSAKTQGVTPGFNIKDSKGDRFVIKFDPPNNPELGSAADVIGSYLFWAAGYNVPDNAVAIFHPDSVDIDPEAKFKDQAGKEKPFTHEMLNAMYKLGARRPDGTIRVITSRFLKGKPLGPYEYHGRRKDDPEDLIPHELRRELRGLWTLCAWTNHADSRGPNSLDMWVEDGGRSFVRHHLIDFSSTLGAASIGPRSPVTGTEYYLDYNVMARQTLSLGLIPFDWEAGVDPRIPSVGTVEAAQFDPDDWRPDYPNSAFDERTERDIRWGARILAGFTDEHIKAAVAAARYSSPQAADYITQVLIQRRDKLLKRWLDPNDRATKAAR
ncbi:MAG: hypothetical protein ABIS67_00975 [Candidatus Eisenbacteria bacterium]